MLRKNFKWYWYTILSNTKLFLGVLIILCMAAGCATFDKQATQILSITKAGQDAGGHSVAYLYHTGKISEENWQDFKKYNDQFAIVHREAVDGMIQYRATKSIGDKSSAEKLIDQVAILAETIQKLVAKLTKKVED